jgi:hypothetical protein
MKRIITFILFALLLLPLEGQIGRYPFYKVTSQEPYMAVLNDGNTMWWFKAESEYITASNDSVSVWKNALGDGGDLWTGREGPEVRPVFKGDSVTFDGTNSVLYRASTPDGTQPFTIYLVFTQLSAPLGWEDENMILFFGSPYLKQNGSSPQITVWGGSSGSTIDGPDIGQRGLVTLILDGDDGYLQVNDNTAAADATYGSNNITSLYVGCNTHITPSAAASNISVCEIIIRNIHDSPEDIELMKDYFNDKYNLW